MNAQRLLALYERIADAPDAVGRLRQFVRGLAVCGKLTPQDPSDECIDATIERLPPQPIPSRYEKRSPETIPGDYGLSINHPGTHVPKGWIWVPLVKVARLESGHTPSRTRPDWWGGNVPWIGLVDARLHNNGTIFETIQTTNDEGLANSAARLLPTGTVCFSRTASVGYVVIMGRPMATSQDFVNWVPSEALSSKWLQLVMITERPAIGRFSKGAVHQTIYYPAWLSMHIALPPVAEQHRIVAKVDELMTLCDRLEAARAQREATRDRLAAASLARLDAPDPDTFRDDARFTLDALPALTTRPDQIKQLRQTVLNLAVRGKLVAQDPAEEPASELLNRIERVRKKTSLRRSTNLKAQRQGSDAPTGWQWSCLGEVYDVRDGTHDTPKYVDAGYPLITSKNLSSGSLSFEGAKAISEHDYRSISNRSRVDRDDILFAMIGSIGNPVVVDTDRQFSIKNVALFKYWDRQLACPEFLRIVLEDAAHTMRRQATGGLQPFVSLGFLRSYRISVPPLAEQHRIVAKVDELMALCDQLEASLAQGDTARRRLLDALLAEALTPEADSDTSERETEAADA